MKFVYSYHIKPELTILGDTYGELFLKGRNNYYDITHLDYSRNLLPLLEKNKREFIDSLSLYIDLNRDLMYTILTRLIKFPFKHEMEYWADLALDWIDFDVFNDLPWLNDVDTAWMPQRIKHKFRKTRSRLRRVGD